MKTKAKKVQRAIDDYMYLDFNDSEQLESMTISINHGVSYLSVERERRDSFRTWRPSALASFFKHFYKG